MNRTYKSTASKSHKRGSERTSASRSGQAMAELVVALICILIVVSGMLQLVLLGTADTNTLVEATSQAANRATSNVILSENFRPISDWEVGQDGFAQTKDDQPVRGNLQPISSRIAGATAPGGDWSALDNARHDAISRLNHGMQPGTTFGLVSGEASESVETLPVATALFGLSDPVEVANTVWMTATGGLY